MQPGLPDPIVSKRRHRVFPVYLRKQVLEVSLDWQNSGHELTIAYVKKAKGCLLIIPVVIELTSMLLYILVLIT
jgi:hypothetical protein